MLRFIWLTGLYLLGAWYAEVFIRGSGDVTLFWPASGVAYAAIVRYGRRWSVFIPGAVLLYHFLFSPVPPEFLLFSVLSNFLGALAGGFVVHLTPTPPRIGVGSGLNLLRGALAMSAVSALVGCAGLVWSGMIGTSDFWPALTKWSLGDLLGILCVAPSLLQLTAPAASGPDIPRAIDYGGTREKAFWLILLLLSFAIVYWGGISNSRYPLAMTSLSLSLLLWSAIRFQPPWTLLATSITLLYLITLVGLGMAGFKPPERLLDSVSLLAIMSLFAIMPLVLLASIYEQRITALKVLRRATTDADTNLPNRLAFEEAAQKALLATDGAKALAYLDLDHFTLINDTASHAAGDALIHGIGSLLKSKLQTGDEIFRIGGDEFALLLGGEAGGIRQRVQELLQAIESYRLGWQDNVLNITGSVGLVMFKRGQLEYARLLSLADAACFTAKELGGNRVCLASQEPGEMLERTQAMHWAVRIREAIDRNLFELDCQSITPLRNQPSTGRHFEMLLRMRDPQTGQRLEPGQFIPAAERFRLGTVVDRHVVNLALGWLEAHPEAAAQVHTCAINLTAASLVDEGFRAFLYDRVRHSRLPAHKLCFEITETSAVRDLARAQGMITQMRSLGCAFALDDFGTGFCSFNYLRTLDVNYFKIDGSFVRDLESSSLSMAVIRSITDIAHVLKKQTIAENTPSEAVCVALRALGVDFAQGFAIHAPEPIEQYFRSAHAPWLVK